jgi:predicted metal-binding protein
MENKIGLKGKGKPRPFKPLLTKARKLGAAEARIMKTDQVVFDPRSHLKCRFGCNRWGNYWTCPPHLSLSQEAFDQAFVRYQTAIVIKTPDPKSGQEIALALEKEAMLQYGCSFALALALCVQCDECAYPDPCRYPHLARPAMDAFGVDVGRTLEPLGFGVEFDQEGKFLPAWYTMILLD